jgi:O-antigen/teichoic acid export membrane protein
MIRLPCALFSTRSLSMLVASELFASAVGFGVIVTLARRLGPSGFADFEYASAVAAWWLVVVRGGFDSIVYREAARRPKVVRPLTDVLIGLRGASAIVGLAAILGWAWASGPDRGRVVAMAGLVLIPSALASDVGLRASGRFGGLAVAQVVRAIGLAVGVACLVAGSGDALVAAGCVVASEVASTVVLLRLHGSEHGPIRPKFRRRAWASLARRGAVAGATRFGRVSLYAADVLILGTVASASLGPYAAARRIAFALLALGLVVPSAVGPRIARAWASGSAEARSVIVHTFEGLSLIVLPATVGLMATADRWMPCLFGEGFREGGPWLALIAVRLPFVLASNVQQAALIACRRESWALRLMVGMVGLGIVVIPPLAMFRGPWGVGLGVLGIEIAGAIGGWMALGRLGVAPAWHHSSGPAVLGCVGMAMACGFMDDWPLGVVVIAGAGVYGLIVSVARGVWWKVPHPRFAAPMGHAVVPGRPSS